MCGQVDVLGMIEDARYFEEDWVPADIKHRHDEMEALADALSPIEHGESGMPSYLFGPTGAGKTTVAEDAVRRLRKTIIGVRSAYVNCWRHYSETKVLFRIVEDATRHVDIHRQSTPKDVLADRIEDVDEQIVVILDEVDQLEETRVLYDLATMTHVTLILIANREEDMWSHMDDRVVSRLRTGERIRFQPYTVSELSEILERRAAHGLQPGSVSQERLEHIADAAHGDARFAILILRMSAQKARAKGFDKITAEVVRKAIPEALEALQSSNRERLTDHQETLLDILIESGPLGPSELYQHYQRHVDDPKTERTVRKYVRKMESYDILETSGASQDRTIRARI